MLKAICFPLKVRSAGLFVFCAYFSLFISSGYAETYDHFLKGNITFNNVLFVESEKGKALNEESGDPTAFGVSYFKQFENYIFARFYFNQASTTLAYDGYTQSALNPESRTRYTTDSEYFYNEFGFHVGRKKINSATYFGFSHHYRERNIKTRYFENQLPALGLYEETRWVEGLIGYDYYLFQSERKHFKIVNRLSASVYGEMGVEFSGAYDGADVETGARYTWFVAAEYFVGSRHGLGISIQPFYRYAQMDKSRNALLKRDGIQQGLFHQPKTEFQEMGIELAMSKAF